jgi:hypothetical protein
MYIFNFRVLFRMAAGAGGGYLNALKKAMNSVLPVSAGTRQGAAATAAQTAAKESQYVTPAVTGTVPVVAAAPQGGQGRRRKHRKTTKKHSRRSRRSSYRRRR